MHSRKGSLGRPEQGITLIEQVMVVTIIAILVTVAVPPFHHLLNRSRLEAAQIDYIAGLRQARASAVNRGIATVFCPSTDGETCDESSTWDTGWLSAEDADHDNQPDKHPLYSGTPGHGELSIRSSSGRQRVRFRPDGSAPGSNLTLLLCLAGRSDHVLSVVVSRSGRVRGAPASADQAADCANADE